MAAARGAPRRGRSLGPEPGRRWFWASSCSCSASASSCFPCRGFGRGRAEAPSPVRPKQRGRFGIGEEAGTGFYSCAPARPVLFLELLDALTAATELRHDSKFENILFVSKLVI